ncbi:MAG: PEP-CTERM sorting domain-containing protein [Pirellulales bacterium]|nr:PEP-CTERM sorting domain-containing protein [Pirellulales bacterium]
MNSLRSTLLVALLLLGTSRLQAQTEIINSITLNPSQSQGYVFPNLLPPHQDYKEFEFLGTATTVPGAFAILQIDFDYLDPQGTNIVVPAPIPQFIVIGGQVNTINTGIFTLPFCPAIVSLHLTNVANAASVPLTVQGTFRHDCIAVPEPSSFALAIAGVLGLGLFRKRFGRRS